MRLKQRVTKNNVMTRLFRKTSAPPFQNSHAIVYLSMRFERDSCSTGFTYTLGAGRWIGKGDVRDSGNGSIPLGSSGKASLASQVPRKLVIFCNTAMIVIWTKAKQQTICKLSIIFFCDFVQQREARAVHIPNPAKS